VGLYFSIERLMCLEICGEKSIGRSIKCLRIDDGGRFTSLEFGNYCKEVGIEGACSVMPSCNKSCGQKWLCYLVNRSPSVAKDWKILEEV
jgi:hypothetical protein